MSFHVTKFLVPVCISKHNLTFIYIHLSSVKYLLSGRSFAPTASIPRQLLLVKMMSRMFLPLVASSRIYTNPRLLVISKMICALSLFGINLYSYPLCHFVLLETSFYPQCLLIDSYGLIDGVLNED